MIVPLVLHPDIRDNAHSYPVIGRLARGVRAAAEADTRRVSAQIALSDG